MRPYDIVARALLILSVFSFVLAAPIAVRKAQGACTDGVNRGKDMVVVSEKRDNIGTGNTVATDPSSSGLNHPGGTGSTLPVNPESGATSVQPGTPSEPVRKTVTWAPPKIMNPDLPLPPGRDGYMAKQAAQQSSGNFFSRLFKSSMTWLRKLAGVLKFKV